MIISVDDNLLQLYNDLKSMGYDVHKMSEKVMSDTLIYSGQRNNFTSIYATFPAQDERGVFIINGDNKTSNEIINMIKERSYSSLF